jgi:hypothetical protein
MTPADPLFDKHRLAVVLNCGVAEALGMMTDGRIRSAMVAGKRQTRQSWVDAFIDSQADGGPTPAPLRMRNRRLVQR